MIGTIKLKKRKKNEKPEVFISLYPKTNEDFAIVGLKNVLSVSNKSVGVAQLKKFVFNHINTKYKDKEAPFDKSKLALEGIKLSIAQRTLDDFELVEEVRKKSSEEGTFFVFYEVTFQN